MAEAVAATRLMASLVSLHDLTAQVAARLPKSASKANAVPETIHRLSRRLPSLTSSLQLILQQAQAGRLPNETIAILEPTIRSTSARLSVIDTYLSKDAPSSGVSRPRKQLKDLHGSKKDANIQLTVDKLVQDIDYISQQSTRHLDSRDRDLDELAKLTLRSNAPAKQYGHAFPSVAAHDRATLHLGDVYNVNNTYHAQEPEKLAGFGLCLGTAPLIEAENFIGRATELDSMAQVLQPGKPTFEQQRLVLGGIGGIGKTQSAIAYARRYQANYTSVFWLNATIESTLKKSMRSIARRLLTRQELEHLDDQSVVHEVLRWLTDPKNKAWLMVFDNYDDPDLFNLLDYVPNSAHGSIIVTTRLPDLVRGQRMRQIRLSPIDSLEENLDILQVRSQRQNVRHGMSMFIALSTE